MGKESKFCEELSKLSDCIDELANIHRDAPVFVRGDLNVSNKNLKRLDMLDYFRSEHNLNQVSIPHATYHYFLGNGLSDSNLDKILFSSSLKHPEVLVTIHCKLEDPLIDSHHDLIVSKWELPTVTPEPSSSVNLVAPKVENPCVKILWNYTGIENYQHLVAPYFLRLQELWLDS